MQAITENCFAGLIGVAPAQFQLYMDAIVWGMKHSMRNVAEISLDMLRALLANMMDLADQTVARQFYKQYLVGTFEHVLAVVSDSSQAQVGDAALVSGPGGGFCFITRSTNNSTTTNRCRWPA